MSSSLKAQIKAVANFREQTQSKAGEFLIGYDKIIDSILTSFLGGGHVLLIGLPGLGKTLLVKVLSAIWGLEFSRIQFTPDLLPSDITGTEIIQEKTGGKTTSKVFEFQEGPVFANLVLADEINRTPPKTQSALLQAMEEKQITIGRDTWQLASPFMVMATQNPIEMEGTYPLPEAQLDRFFMSIHFEYPSREEEAKIALISSKDQNLDRIKPVANIKSIESWKQVIDKIAIPDSVLNFIVDSIRNTRPQGGAKIAERYGEYGAGPRATQYLVRAGRAKALLLGESVVTEDIVKATFHDVLRHRVLLNYSALAEKISVDDYLTECFD